MAPCAAPAGFFQIMSKPLHPDAPSEAAAPEASPCPHPADAPSLSDLFDFPSLQSMLDNLSALTGFSLAIADLDGSTRIASGWQDICTQFHRVHPESCRHCLASDTLLSAGVNPGTCKLYQCENHLNDMATPLVVGDRHLGNLFLGQFFFDDAPPQLDVFRAQARRYGFPEADYLAALDRVPRWPRPRVEQAMSFFSQFACHLSDLGFRNLQLARTLASQRQTEERLQQQKNLFRSILESSSEAIFAKDAQGQYISINTAGARMLGHAPDEIIGRTDADLLPPDTALEFRKTDQQVMASGQPMTRDEIGLIDGQPRIFLAHKTPWQYQSGQIAGIIGVSSDITGRKQAEQSLQESEQLYRSILTASPDDITITDLEGRILIVSPSALAMFGCERESQLVGHPVIEFILPAERERAVADISRLLHGASTGPVGYRGEYRGMRANGSVFDIEVNGEFIRDSQGRPARIVLVVRDISERKRQEAALRESENRFRNMAELLPEAIFEIDRNARIGFANKRAFALFGFSEDDLALGLNALDLIVPEERTAARERLLRRLAGSPTGTQEYHALRRDGSTFPVILNLAPKILDGHLVGFLGALTDITALKQAEAALVSSEQRYRTFIDATSDLVFLKDAAFRYLISNRANNSFLGKSEANVIGKTDFDLMPRDSAQHCRDSDEDAIRQGESVISEECIGPKIYQTLKFPVALPGQPTGVGGYIRDITDRKRAEEKLRASEERYRDIATNIPGVIYQLQAGRTGSLVVPYMSAGCESLFEQPLVGLDFSSLLFGHMDEDDHALFHQSLAQAAKNLERWNLEFRIHPAPGRVKWLRGSANPQRLPNGTLIWNGVLLDITELKQAERDMARQMDELRRWQLVTLGREDRIAELKREVNELSARLGRPAPYSSPEAP